MRLWPKRTPAKPASPSTCEEAFAPDDEPWQPNASYTTGQMNDHFRKAVTAGKPVRGAILLGRDVTVLSEKDQQEVLDQIAHYTPNPAAEDGVGESQFQNKVFALRAIWGWAIDRYSDSSQMELVGPASAFEGLCNLDIQGIDPEDTYPVMRVWKIEDVKFD